MKAKIIAVGCHKGGVSKTTTVTNLGSILAQRGYKVLLVDLDAQATTDIIIPMVSEVLPFKGLTMVKDFVAMGQHRLNPSARIMGILITRWESGKLSRGIEANLRQALGDMAFRTKTRKNVRLAGAPLEKTDIVGYDPRSNGAIDYQAFADEFLGRILSTQ